MNRKGTIYLIVLVVIASPFFQSSFASDPPKQQREWRTILDFSEDDRPRLPMKPVPKDQLPMVARALKMGDYFTSENEEECYDRSKVILDARQIEGRFIPGGTQTLIKVHTRLCGYGHKWKQSELLLRSNGKTKAIVRDACAGIIQATVTTKSGLLRVIGTCGGTWQGATIISGDYYGFYKGKFRKIRTFGTVYLEECGAAGDGAAETVSVFFQDIESGELRIKNYRRSCASLEKGVKEYQFISDGPMQHK